MKIKKKKRIDTKRKLSSINWAIIGLGNMANTFARALNVVPRSQIVAVASRSQNKANCFAKKYGVSHAYGDYKTMLEDKTVNIDIVYIATPVYCHYENIKMALMSGKNVVCEKPIVMNGNELDELKKLAKEKNLFLTEGMWMLFLPTLLQAKKWIAENKIGNIRSIRIDLSKMEKIDPSSSKYSKEKNVGVLYDYGIYPIAFVTSFLDSPIDIAHAKKGTHKSGYDNDWIILLESNSINVTVTVSATFEGSKKAAIIGDEGSIVWDGQFNRTNTVSCFDSTGKKCDSVSFDYYADGFEYEIEEIQNCLVAEEKESLSVPLCISDLVIEMLEKIQSFEGDRQEEESDNESNRKI